MAGLPLNPELQAFGFGVYGFMVQDFWCDGFGELGCKVSALDCRALPIQWPESCGSGTTFPRVGT